MNRLLLILLLLFARNVFALEDSLMKSMEIATKGNDVQAERIKIAAENLANEHTTSEKPGGAPYRRKVIYVENKFDKKKKAHLVRVKKYSEDKKSPIEVRYEPSHPSAGPDGYVQMPNVRKAIELADASEAQRSYEANLGIIELSRSMIGKTLDVIR